MANLVLSPIINGLVDYSFNYLENQLELRSDVNGKLKELREYLLRVQAVVRASDEVVEMKNEHLAAWLGQLQEAAYEAEDVLDEFEYRRLEQQATGSPAQAKVRCLFSPHKIFRIPASKLLKNLGRILKKFEKLAAASGDLLQLFNKEHTGWVSRIKSEEKRLETTSFIQEPEFIGRTEVCEEIIHLLLGVCDRSASIGTSTHEIPIVPVIGPGGFGKTTLAQHVFNDPRVKTHFKCMMWAHVSHNFDVKRLSKEMIESASGHKCDIENLDRLQHDLKEVVGLKRFILVLDDMWCDDDWLKTEKYWTSLLAPLVDGASERGSIILLTTQNENLKHLPGALTPFFLRELKDDECWSIIRARAFGSDQIPDGCQNLIDIGKKIAGKVRGTPLAAKTVGGMLRVNWDYDEWNKILDRGLDAIPGVIDVLKVSYRHLPPHLRKCFAYCSLYPKGYVFHQKDIECLGRMWVAHGFTQAGDRDSIDEAGRKCFDDLLSRSFFQAVYRRDSVAYVMHDLMNDLARQVSQGDCLAFEGDNLPEGNVPQKVRHISISRVNQLAELRNKGFKFENLRSFLLLDSDDEIDCGHLREVLRKLLRIRVLFREDHTRKGFPDYLGDLIHLRYLHFGYNMNERFPESFYKLYHLQMVGSMKAYGRNLEFTKKVNNLTNLRILQIKFNGAIAFLGKLTSLEAFEYPFSVGKERGHEIGQLKRLDRLRGILRIENLENVESRHEAEAANLCGKTRLEELWLTWEHGRHVPSLAVEGDVLEALQPPSNLKRLKINGYQGSKCPSWMLNQWLSNLRTIELAHLTELVQLPPLGQLPLLEILQMNRLTALRKLGGHGFYGYNGNAFPSLKKMEIKNMAKLEEWSRPDEHVTCFPRLQDLSMRDCPELRDGGFQVFISLQTMKIVRCPKLTWVTHIHIQEQEDARGLLPSSLKYVDIYECHVLGDDLYWSRSLQGLPNLHGLRICKLMSLISLPPIELFQYLKTLKQLIIVECESLTTQGLASIQALVSVEYLAIRGCPGLLIETSSPMHPYLTGSAFSSSLKQLVIDNILLLTTVPILKTISSLHQLLITDVFEGTYLPSEIEEFLWHNRTTLSVFTLWRTSFLKLLPANFECLSSLEQLVLYDARKLESLPDLPHSLSALKIYRASREFERRCERHIGRDWPKIQHISWIDISDDSFIPSADVHYELRTHDQ